MLRRPSIGDELAASRLVLAQRLEEARDTVRTVLASPPYDPCEVPDVARSDSPLADVDLLLHGYLDRFMSMVFNGRDSVPLAVSGRRLKKVSRRLHEAAERFAAASQPVARLARELAERFPDCSPSVHERAAAALLVLDEWDARTSSDARDLAGSPAASCLVQSMARDGRARLALFVCCPVDFTRLSGDHPEAYLGTDMHGSVLSRLVPRLRELFRGLEGAAVDLELLTIVGDTDEDDYIWHGIEPPARLDRAALDVRRDALVEAVAAYATEELGDDGGREPRLAKASATRVIRLSAVAPSPRALHAHAAVVADPFACFDRQDVADEVDIMKGLWQPGSYYRGLDEPDPATLERIVVHKLATYAMQGVLLWELEPSLVLVQTERPPILRDKMLNAGRRLLGLPPLVSIDYFAPERGR